MLLSPFRTNGVDGHVFVNADNAEEIGNSIIAKMIGVSADLLRKRIKLSHSLPNPLQKLIGKLFKLIPASFSTALKCWKKQFRRYHEV